MEIKTTKKYLSPKQQAVLDYVSDHIRRFGFSPTQMEISKATGFGRPLVLYHLNELGKKGLIKRAGAHRRNIKVVHN